MIVVLMSIASSMGIFRPNTLLDLFGSIIITILLWMLWVLIVYNLSNLFLPKSRQIQGWGPLFRTLGVAQSPGSLHLIGALISPGLISTGGALSFLLVWAIVVWQISCSAFAINSLIENHYNGKVAIGITITSLIPFVVIILVLLAI